MSERWTAFDLAEGFQLAHAVATLHDEGVLASLEHLKNVEALATEHNFDVDLLRAILQYVAARTDIIEQQEDKYVVTPNYGTEARFFLDQYIGAYGPNASNLHALLRNPSGASEVVDREQYTKAFKGLEGPGLRILPDIIRQLEFNHLLDLGCGPGSLLLELAICDSNFIGWGVDFSPSMCRSAKNRLKAAGVDDRIVIFEGNCIELEAAIPNTLIDQVDTITAASLFNEFFAPDSTRAVSLLTKLREYFPGRVLLVVDYYGCLGKYEPPWPRRTVLHDFVQTISGQGVPPANLAAWQEIYRAAGCNLVYVMEDQNASFFIHILRL